MAAGEETPMTSSSFAAGVFARVGRGESGKGAAKRSSLSAAMNSAVVVSRLISKR
jgi:hypothetical protein